MGIPTGGKRIHPKKIAGSNQVGNFRLKNEFESVISVSSSQHLRELSNLHLTATTRAGFFVVTIITRIFDHVFTIKTLL